MTVIVAAHDEESVIERRLEDLLAQDYPAELFDVIVASDASTDRTDDLVEAFAAREPRVRLLRCPRGGKVAAQNLAVRQTDAEIVAFSDANSTWKPDALRLLVRSLADPDVSYVCGQLRLLAPDGANREGLYWRYEMWVRKQESSLGSINGGNGSIYAVRRADWIDVDPRYGHDMSFPYSFVQRGKRAVYDEEPLAFEKPARDTEDEYRRKVRMFEHAWLMLFQGGMLRGVGPLYAFELAVAPAPALRERLAAPPPARHERRARRARRRGRVLGRARPADRVAPARPGGPGSVPAPGRRDRALLRGGQLGHGRLLRPVPALRMPGRVGEGARDPLAPFRAQWPARASLRLRT